MKHTRVLSDDGEMHILPHMGGEVMDHMPIPRASKEAHKKEKSTKALQKKKNLEREKSRLESIHKLKKLGFGAEDVIAYCMRCHEKVPMENAEEVTTANNRHMMKGVCPRCESTVCRFI